jgi:hypothetical protein
VYLPSRWGIVAVVAGWCFVFAIWLMFLMPTRCHYDVGHHGCTRQVYGKLRGCYQHAELKRDAVWAALGRRNPGLAVRLTWGNSRNQYGRRVGDDPGMSGAAAQQGLVNAANLLFAAGSFFVAVIALFLSK